MPLRLYLLFAAFDRFFGNVDFERNPYIAIENDGGTVR